MTIVFRHLAGRRLIDLQTTRLVATYDTMTSTIATLISRGLFGQAEEACQVAISGGAPGPMAYIHLSTIHLRTDRPAGALRAAWAAVALAPSDTQALNNISGAWRAIGSPAQAATWAKRSLALDIRQLPILSHLIFALNELGHPAVQAAARAFEALTRHPPMAARASRPGRLRVGMVSADFRNHVCMTFLSPLLEHIDRRRFHLTAYSATRLSDDTTAMLKTRFDRWQDIHTLSDEQAADLVRDDEIDVLVDLGGHTNDSRLGLFAIHPARTQVSWLGYNGTTGLGAMDWRIADRWIVPEDGSQWFAERVLRLPRVSHCWRPPDDAPPVSHPPSALGQPFTFGSFNNIAKLSRETIAAWARVLLAVPGARLLLKSRFAGEPETRDRLIARFVAVGVAADRILFRPPSATQAAHLSSYADMDVALDPFPYNGTTTTCEALWMGVPVVAIRGASMLSRISYSLLASLKLEDRLSGDTVDEMVAICARLAGDRAELTALRAGMRSRFETSSLRDEAGFAAAMEKAFMRAARQAAVQPLT